MSVEVEAIVEPAREEEVVLEILAPDVVKTDEVVVVFDRRLKGGTVKFSEDYNKGRGDFGSLSAFRQDIYKKSSLQELARGAKFEYATFVKMLPGHKRCSRLPLNKAFCVSIFKKLRRVPAYGLREVLKLPEFREIIRMSRKDIASLGTEENTLSYLFLFLFYFDETRRSMLRRYKKQASNIKRSFREKNQGRVSFEVFMLQMRMLTTGIPEVILKLLYNGADMED